LSKNPALLLCDEPTGALDSNTGRLVLKLLQDVGNDMGKTVVVITHNAAIIPAAKRVIRMKNGKIQEITTNDQPLRMEDIVW
jgi:putative ABC transport system ATP-binding protein